MSDRITFDCQQCGTTLAIDEANPPNDADIFRCNGCGREIGLYGEVKAAMIEAGKAEIEKLIADRFPGAKPKWTKS